MGMTRKQRDLFETVGAFIGHFHLFVPARYNLSPYDKQLFEYMCRAWDAINELPDSEKEVTE